MRVAEYIRRSCKSKVPWDRPKPAYKAIRRYCGKNGTDIFAVYPCQYCGYYHIGHKEDVKCR